MARGMGVSKGLRVVQVTVGVRRQEAGVGSQAVLELR